MRADDEQFGIQIRSRSHNQQDPEASANWYVRDVWRDDHRQDDDARAPQIFVDLSGMTILIRGQRLGENPAAARPIQLFTDFSSHNAWGTDRFGFLYRGDLDAFCAELRGKGASFPVELKPASAVAAFVTFAAPDSVSMMAVPEQVPRCGQADIQGFDIPPLAGLPSS